MSQAPDDEATFRSIFERPTIQRMLEELDPYQFEDFVAYVFRQAGYTVEDVANRHGDGLDLKLYAGSPVLGMHAGVQVKHFQPSNQVVAPDVMRLKGGVAQNHGNVGYFVTTSTFKGPALDQMRGTPPIIPLDGAHFVRFIEYVHGSYATIGAHRHDGSPKVPPISPHVLFEAQTIQRRPLKQTKVLTVANHKGGVGKTTTAVNLGFGLAAKGNQVLLVDLDTQANLTRGLAYPIAAHAIPRHMGEYFSGICELAELVSLTAFSQVWLLPAAPELRHVDHGLTAGPEQELRLLRDLHADSVAPPAAVDARPFDWIVIDTGPYMGFFARSALAASSYVVLPLAPGFFADTGLELLTETVATMQALTGYPIEILGCLVTQWHENALNKQLLAKAAQALAEAGVPLFETRIPLDKAHIEKAYLETGQGKKKNLFNQTSPAAKAYTAFVEEVLHRVNANKQRNTSVP